MTGNSLAVAGSSVRPEVPTGDGSVTEGRGAVVTAAVVGSGSVTGAVVGFGSVVGAVVGLGSVVGAVVGGVVWTGSVIGAVLVADAVDVPAEVVEAGEAVGAGEAAAVVVLVLVVEAVLVVLAAAVLVVLAVEDGSVLLVAVTFVTLPFFQLSRSVESVSNAETDSPDALAIIIAWARG